MKFTGKILQQARYWMIAASMLPLTALSGLFFLEKVGWETNLEKSVTIIATSMFFIAVAWWWWAIKKIMQFAKMIEKTEQDFLDVKDLLKDMREKL